ncbi:uncharacterized protein RBU57_017695 [Macrochelys suwanniensis]
MACELFLLSSLWVLFVIFWMETISLWFFLCNFYQDRAFYHWGERVFVSDPGHMLYVFVSSAGPGRPQTCSQRSGRARRARGWSPPGHGRAMRGIPGEEAPTAAPPPPGSEASAGCRTPAGHCIEPWPLREPTSSRGLAGQGPELVPSCWSVGGGGGCGHCPPTPTLRDMAGIQSQEDGWVLLPFVGPPVILPLSAPCTEAKMELAAGGGPRPLASASVGVQAAVHLCAGPCAVIAASGLLSVLRCPSGQRSWVWRPLPRALLHGH